MCHCLSLSLLAAEIARLQDTVQAQARDLERAGKVHVVNLCVPSGSVLWVIFRVREMPEAILYI